jgi:alkylated DNA repair dioxygenase AlkB
MTSAVPAAVSATDQVVGAIGQLTLGMDGEPALDPAFATAARTVLDEHSWIDVVPGWITGSDALFQQIAHAAPWQQHWRRMYDEVFQEPRFTAEFPAIEGGPVPFLETIAAALQARYGVLYDSVWMNFYRDETKGTGWHADRPANRPPEAIVPVLSLGAARRFLIKHRDGGPSTGFTPASGDLLAMGGRAQRDWLHAAPKQAKPAGPRISLNFGSSEQNAR